jgi:transposase-like protein
LGRAGVYWEHWRSLRNDNPLERLKREIRRCTRVVGAFPDGNSALILPLLSCHTPRHAWSFALARQDVEW